MEFKFNFSNTRNAAIKFEQFPEAARVRLVEVITGLTAELNSAVHAAAPTKSGKLQSEIQSFVDQTKDRVIGKVKVVAGGNLQELLKAIALEYGARQPTEVRAHSQELTTVFGKKVSPETVMVAAYNRTPNIAAGNYMRGPLAAMQPEIIAALNAAVADAAAA
jgi:hypothetical protein